MQKTKLKILAFLVLCILVLSTSPKTSPLAVKAQEDTTLTYDIYVEIVDILYGENRAVGAIASRMGGTVDLGFDINDHAFDHLEMLVLTFGKGLDWTRYLHKPLWEIPPGVMLTIRYRVGGGFTEDQAVQQSFAAARIIGNAYGLKFYVMWEEKVNNIVSVIFYALMDEDDFNTFFSDTFKNILGSEGLMGLVTEAAITTAPYARLILFVGKDIGDADRDGDYQELVPAVGVAFIAEDAIVEDEDGFFVLSINNVFQHSGPITWLNESIWSAVTVKIPFPVRLDRNASTPTNSSFPGVTGKYLYVLRAKNLETGWECSWPSTLHDIVIRYLPYNYTERMTKFPVLKAMFTAEPYPYGTTATHLSLILKVTNVGTAPARNAEAVVPLDNRTYELFQKLIEFDILELYGWKLKAVISPEGEIYSLTASIGTLDVNETYTAEIRLNYNEWFNPQKVGGLLPWPVGPIVSYEDDYGLRYGILANGLYYPLSVNGSFVIPEIRVETPTGESYVEVGDTVDIIVNLTNYGALPARNINVTVMHAIVDENGRIIELEPIDFINIDFINDSYYNPIDEASVEIRTTYFVRTRPGLHFVGAIVEYEGEATYNASTIETFTYLARPMLSNLISMFVLPPYRIRGNIFRYPLPHAEVIVNKTLEIDNETRKIKVRIELTNVGDINTTITHVVDYWNASVVDFVTGSVTVNETSFGTVYTFVNNKIDILYIAIGSKANPIELPVNQTVIIEYELDIKMNGTFELISNPTVVFYDFGPYEMEEEESIQEEESSTEGGLFYTQTVRLLQETTTGQFVQTFTQAMIELVSIVTAPPEEELPPPSPAPRIPRLLIVLMGLALVVIVVAAVIIRRRR